MIFIRILLWCAYAFPLPVPPVKETVPMHVHISGLDGLITVLYVIAIMGALNLLAMHLAARGNKLALAWCDTFGLSV